MKKIAIAAGIAASMAAVMWLATRRGMRCPEGHAEVSRRPPVRSSRSMLGKAWSQLQPVYECKRCGYIRYVDGEWHKGGEDPAAFEPPIHSCAVLNLPGATSRYCRKFMDGRIVHDRVFLYWSKKPEFDEKQERILLYRTICGS